MSAFVVSDKHINSILSTAYHLKLGKVTLGGRSFDFGDRKDLQLMASMFLSANELAVDELYSHKDNVDNVLESVGIVFQLTPALSLVALHKALVCLDYQCGDAGSWEKTIEYLIYKHLYDTVTSLILQIKGRMRLSAEVWHKYISGLDEWNKAAWEIE